jgi:hypothetical protein
VTITGRINFDPPRRTIDPLWLLDMSFSAAPNSALVFTDKNNRPTIGDLKIAVATRQPPSAVSIFRDYPPNFALLFRLRDAAGLTRNREADIDELQHFLAGIGIKVSREVLRRARQDAGAKLLPGAPKKPAG